MQEFIPYGTQWINETDVKAVQSVLTSGFLTQGPYIAEFEKKIIEITGARFCVAVCNATQALHIAVSALDLPKGSEGITTPITFVASANCLPSNGLKAVFADIDNKTYNISPLSIRQKITAKTKVLIPVDYAGQAVDIDAIKKIADEFSLKIIEDAAHAIGSYYTDGMPVGCCHKADMTIFSFHPCKTITCGEGGAITTNSEALYKKLLMLRTIGITKDEKELSKNPGPWYYEMKYLSGNNRMTDIQAALGTSQLKKLDFFKKRRKDIITSYNTAFTSNPYITIPYEAEGSDSCFHLYVIRINFPKLSKTRVQVMEELKSRGIGTQVHYIPVNSQPYYTSLEPFNEKDYPESSSFYNECLSIPLYPKMSDADIERVIKAVNEVVS